MLRVNPAGIGFLGALLVTAWFLSACSRKAGTDNQKPLVFFAPDMVSNVPAVYKPLYLGNLPADRVEAFRASLPYETISLERTTNAATGPIYRVTFHRSGQAEFVVFQPKPSQATGQIDLPTFARLCYALDTGDFKDFRDKYRADPLENRACTVIVSKGKSGKIVVDYGTIGPIQLWTIEQLIDGTRAQTAWKLVSK